MQQDKDPASNPDWLRKVEQAERSGDFFPKDSVIINGGKIEDRLVQEIEVIRLVYTNEDFQGIRKEPVTPTSTPKPEHPTETIRTQPGSRRIHRPDQTEIVIDQLIKQGNKAPDKSGTILRAIAAAGNIVPHIPVGVGMVGRETVEAGERFYNRTWSQRGEAALMWWEQIALTVPKLHPYAINKAALNAYSSYLHNPEPFNSFAADGSQNGLSAQIGIGIGKNLTYAAASYAVAAPFAGAGGTTTIFNGETIPWRTVTTGANSSIANAPGSRSLRVFQPTECFVAGTLVWTLFGQTQAIETIKVGDLVLSKDERSGEIGYKTVTAIFSHYVEEILDIVVAGQEEIPLGVTPTHPFRVHRARSQLTSEDSNDGDGETGWVKAQDIQAGDSVQLPSGEWIKVLKISRRQIGAWVYNFEVADFHTYFIGRFGVWVHNNCPRNLGKLIDDLRSGKDVIVSSAEEARALLDAMGDLRPASGANLLPNAPTLHEGRNFHIGGYSQGFADPPGTFRGDLLNIHAPDDLVHPNIDNVLHAENPHYNIYFHDRTKAAIIIQPKKVDRLGPHSGGWPSPSHPYDPNGGYFGK